VTVAVLFARADSIYKTLPGVEVYDMERDARTYAGFTWSRPSRASSAASFCRMGTLVALGKEGDEVSTDQEQNMRDKIRGLYNKFRVERVDGSSEPGGKHHGCEYFVLDLTHDKHARAALLAYAESCKEEYPLLAADLFQKAGAMK